VLDVPLHHRQHGALATLRPVKEENTMGLLDALGLAPAAAMQGKAPTAPVAKPAASSSAPTAAGGKPQSPEMQALVTRFGDTMVRIKTLKVAGSPTVSNSPCTVDMLR
jgi:hypothetical protein